MKALHILISGVVQGVSFRYYTKDKADKLGLTGWVKNRDDGMVEILVIGKEEILEDFIQWCRRGSPVSLVKDVKTEETEIDKVFSSFEIRFT